MGLDSDHPLADGEVGKVGVAIDSLDDMRRLLDGIPLGEVSTSMTINATAAILLLLYQLVAEEQSVEPDRVRGTVQNDILKEYIARGTYIYPPAPSMRLVTDVFAYCAKELPGWNTISVSGYHMREAGSTAAQELAFTIADGLAYVEAAQTRRPRRRSICSPTFLFLEFAQRPFRGDREVPSCTANVGTFDARSDRSNEPALVEDALSHPDGRVVAHSPAAAQQHHAGLRSRRWLPCSAVRSRSTLIRSTRRSDCQLRNLRLLRSEPSRSWLTSWASPTSSTRWQGRTTSSR